GHAADEHESGRTDRRRELVLGNPIGQEHGLVSVGAQRRVDAGHFKLAIGADDQHAIAAAISSSTIASARSRSASSITRGGASTITLPCPTLNESPRARQR